MLETSEIHGTWADHNSDLNDFTLPSFADDDALWTGLDDWMDNANYDEAI